MLAFLNARSAGAAPLAQFRAAALAAHRCRRIERHGAAVIASFQAVAEALELAAPPAPPSPSPRPTPRPPPPRPADAPAPAPRAEAAPAPAL